MLLVLPEIWDTMFKYRDTLIFLQNYQMVNGKCIRRFGGIYAYYRYFIDLKW